MLWRTGAIIIKRKEIEMNQQEYNMKFTADKELLKIVFTQASDIRKFEIELYWKRATYFWALIAVSFAGYFGILTADSDNMDNKFFLSLLVACIGLVFTFAWYLANRGSKYWQENWEAHLDLLEDGITGPLYKTHLTENKENKCKLINLLTGSLRVSISEINQWVNFFVMLIWISLISFSTYKSFNIYPLKSCISLLHFGIIFITILCCIFMCISSMAHDKDYTLKATSREVKISS